MAIISIPPVKVPISLRDPILTPISKELIIKAPADKKLESTIIFLLKLKPYVDANVGTPAFL